MEGLNAFGLLAVTLMLVTYALEDRTPWFILGFGGACALGSVYGFLQGAWPFGLVEAIWALVAIRRWRLKVEEDEHDGSYAPPIVTLAAVISRSSRLIAALTCDALWGYSRDDLVLNWYAPAPPAACELMLKEQVCCGFWRSRCTSILRCGSRSEHPKTPALCRCFIPTVRRWGLGCNHHRRVSISFLRPADVGCWSGRSGTDCLPLHHATPPPSPPCHARSPANRSAGGCPRVDGCASHSANMTSTAANGLRRFIGRYRLD
jgi:hypothetical protein